MTTNQDLRTKDQAQGKRAAGTGQDQTSDRQSLKLGRMDGSFRLPKFSFIRSWLAVVSVLAGLTARGRADIVPLTRLTDASARCMDGIEGVVQSNEKQSLLLRTLFGLVQSETDL